MSADGPLSEKEHYREFVRKSIQELKYGLSMDGTASKENVLQAVTAVMNSDHDSAVKVLCARFALGADDDAYLQSGLAVLWSTAASNDRTDDLALAPAALYSPDAVGGIRRGLLRALEAKHTETKENAEDNLRVLVRALEGILTVPTLSKYAETLRKHFDTDPVDQDHVALARDLCALKGLLDGESNRDLADGILNRVDCLTKLIKTREKLKLANERAEKSAGESAEQAAASLKALQDQTKAEIVVLTAEIAALEGYASDAPNGSEVREYYDSEGRFEVERQWLKSTWHVFYADRRRQRAVAKLSNAQAVLAALLAAAGAPTVDAPQNQESKVYETKAREDKTNAEAELQATHLEFLKARRVESVIRYNVTEAKLSEPTEDEEGNGTLGTWEEDFDQPEYDTRENYAATPKEVKSFDALGGGNTTLMAPVRSVSPRVLSDEGQYWRKHAIEQEKTEKAEKVLYRNSRANRWANANLLNYNVDEEGIILKDDFVFQNDNTFMEKMKATWQPLLNNTGGQQEVANWGYNMTSQLPSGQMGPLYPFQPSIDASVRDPHVATALVRGLVGQRGPTEPAGATGDALLPYALPPPAPLAKSLPVARMLLERLAAPTAHEVDAALAALARPPPKPAKTTDATSTDATVADAPAAKRARVLALPKATPTSVLHSALAEFGDNFAVVGATPAAEDDARGGVEKVHQVRWLPQGPRAATMAKAAVLEHAIARCTQLLESKVVSEKPAIAQAVRDAAAALKLRQLEPLYALHEAAAFDDAPHPLGTATPLVTRPCAIVRGTLSYPTDPGVAPMPFECAPSAYNANADVKGAMDTTKGETAALRNALRREGVAANVYVAPAVDKLGYEWMATAAVAGATAAVAPATAAVAGATVTEDAKKPEAQEAHQATEEAVSAVNTATTALKKSHEETIAAFDKLSTALEEERRVKRERANKKADVDEYEGMVESLANGSDVEKGEATQKLNAAKEALAKLDEELPRIDINKTQPAENTLSAFITDQTNAMDSVVEALTKATGAVQRAEKAVEVAKEEAAKAVADENERREKLSADLAASFTNESVYATDFALPTLRRLVNQSIVTLAAIKHKGENGDDCTDPVGAFLREERMQNVDGVDAHSRREGLWTEFHRHVSISQDRLWVFVRLLSGGIGGDVNEIITMADEASQQATKALQAQRVEVAKRVSDTQSKIVESVVAAMLKESRLALDTKDDNLVVMDTEMRKELRDLASGASGRPFFEANVACRDLFTKTNQPMRLTKLLSNLAAVGVQMHRSLDATLMAPGLDSASLSQLSHPSNSFFVSLKTDASAAIRIAHERCNSELAMRGGSRRIALWELIEGGCAVLTTRFAEFTGHILVQNRTSTGLAAMYVSHIAITTNAHQARVSLSRLMNAARVYVERVPRPAFGIIPAKEDVALPRKDAMDSAARVQECDVAINRRRDSSQVGYGHLFRAQSHTGWWVW